MVELLVVIVILLMLVTVVLPLAQPNSKDRLVREAARQVNSFVAGVQARAVAENRAYGVILVRDLTSEGPVYDLAMARAPKVYSGDEGSALASVDPTTTPWQATLFDASRMYQSHQNTLAGNMRFVDVGDLIRFNFRGPWYVISDVDFDSNNDPVLEFSGQNGSAPAPPEASLSYQIRRMPRVANGRTSRASGSTMSLPVGAYLDLSVSGTGHNGANLTTIVGPGPAIIMIDPSGQLSSIDVNGSTLPIQGSLYLLVGAAKEIVGAANVPLWQNTVRNLDSNAGSVWVSVGGAAGRLTTVQNLGATFQISGTTARVFDLAGNFQDFDLSDKDAPNFGEGGWYDAKHAAVAVSRATANTGPAAAGR